MKCWLVNHSYDDYRKTFEYLGFESGKERDILGIGDRVVYFGKGLVAGIFEVSSYAENEFSGWSLKRPFQVKIRAIAIPVSDLVARPFYYKVQLEKPIKGSSSIFSLSGQEFGKTVLAIEEKKRELVF